MALGPEAQRNPGKVGVGFDIITRVLGPGEQEGLLEKSMTEAGVAHPEDRQRRGHDRRSTVASRS